MRKKTFSEFQIKIFEHWTSMAVQWLGLLTLTAEGQGSIPRQGTKIPQAAWRGPKKTKRIFEHTLPSSQSPILMQGGNETGAGRGGNLPAPLPHIYFSVGVDSPSTHIPYPGPLVKTLKVWGRRWKRMGDSGRRRQR